jgi:hypothetical protein
VKARAHGFYAGGRGWGSSIHDGSPISDLPQSPATPAAPPRFSPVHPAPACDPLPALPSATPSISPPSTTIVCVLPSDSLRWCGPSIDADPYCYLKIQSEDATPPPISSDVQKSLRCVNSILHTSVYVVLNDLDSVVNQVSTSFST